VDRDTVGAPELATAMTVELSPPRERLDRLVSGADHDPHSVLGRHVVPGENGDPGYTVVRTLRPDAESVTLVSGTDKADDADDGDSDDPTTDTGKADAGEGTVRVPMRRIHDGGVFAAALDEIGDYRLEVTYGTGAAAGTWVVDDPYRWMPTLGDMDLHLIGEGRHEKLWEVLGAHERTYRTPGGPVDGVSFAVWAPTAGGVRVVGDWNYWDGRALPMRSLGSSGVWELFVPGVTSGARYKFEVLGRDGRWREKADPMAFATERPPATASVVHTSHYTWDDGEWLSARAGRRWHEQPMSVYEVHLGSWRQGLSYTELADQLVEYVVEMGFTHVELLPVAEHPFGGSWGYQVTAYFAPTSRFGSPDEFRFLVDRLHQAGVGVIVDWVPAHFPKDEWALSRFDGTPLYEHGDPRRGEHPDWGTNVFDFGRREVRNFLVANALFWLEEFHVDGLRVDAVASMLYLDYSREEGQWLPNIYGGRENLDAVGFLQETNATVYRDHDGAMTVAEESTAWPGVTRPTHLGGLGFGFKWNMGWMHDTLAYLSKEPVYRQYHHHQMTFSLMYAWSENYVLPLSHDEVVHGKGSLVGKMPGDRWQKLANLRAMYAYMWAHPGKQLLFMGGEMAQEAEWAEGRSLDWWLLENADHSGVQRLVRDLNHLYREHSCLWSLDTDPSGFSWIDANDAAGNVFSFLRFGSDGSVIACVANFAGMPHRAYRVGLPHAGRWTEILNTDADLYGGSGVGNLGGVDADTVAWHGRPASATLEVPPLGAVWLRYDGK
jgi:1,4-alpha-glucan branching enzyme